MGGWSIAGDSLAADVDCSLVVFALGLSLAKNKASLVVNGGGTLFLYLSIPLLCLRWFFWILRFLSVWHIFYSVHPIGCCHCAALSFSSHVIAWECTPPRLILPAVLLHTLSQLPSGCILSFVVGGVGRDGGVLDGSCGRRHLPHQRLSKQGPLSALSRRHIDNAHQV